MEGIKIRCKNRYWARMVQLVLQRTIGASWGNAACVIPWSTFRLWLVVRKGVDGKWYISWCPEGEFEGVPLPEWDAKQLIQVAPSNA